MQTKRLKVKTDDPMKDDHTWLPQMLVVGLVTNMYLLDLSFDLHPDVPQGILIPAQVFILVAAFRCTFPNRYNNNIVLHDTWFSCTWLTRFMATFSETFWL
jgi:hypothetical protein